MSDYVPSSLYIKLRALSKERVIGLKEKKRREKMICRILLLIILNSCLCVQENIRAVPGKNVSLPCQVPNKKPAVFVKWTRPDLEPEYVLLFRDEQLDPELQHPSYQNRVDLQDRQMKDGDVSLVLENVTTNDRGTYECRVFQREANRRKRHTLTFDPIAVIFLDVAPPQENMEGRTEDGSSHQRAGLMAVAGLIITVAVGVVIKKYRSILMNR
ncbi:butyrophilin-like protein 9 isoform X1 [Fundulus heteroclitus]|uniref:butyrophilin-like protein 9 isoform X1 n=1 Tax=Fundulus heteroclitus TaxID=8078 RepID=UPI00165B4B4D|nr:butyrophilin-like protein 9 isoform X1 [Fundulus heteroclitus]